MVSFTHQGKQYRITFHHLDKSQMIKRGVKIPRPKKPTPGLTIAKLQMLADKDEKKQWQTIHEVQTFANPADRYSKINGKIWALGKIFDAHELFAHLIEVRGKKIIHPQNKKLQKQICVEFCKAYPTQIGTNLLATIMTNSRYLQERLSVLSLFNQKK